MKGEGGGTASLSDSSTEKEVGGWACVVLRYPLLFGMNWRERGGGRSWVKLCLQFLVNATAAKKGRRGTMTARLDAKSRRRG